MQVNGEETMGRSRKSQTKQEPSRKAIAYTRVSTAEQSREGVSLDSQEARLKAYAQAAGLELVDVLREEGVSGTVPLRKRPQGARLLAALEAGEAQHVVTIRLDRAFRSVADCLTVTSAWDAAGVAFHLVDMGGQSINTATAMGRMFLTMTAAFAELERNLIAERTSAALRHKQARGEHVGRVPQGAQVRSKRLVADADALALYRRATRLREQGMTYQEVAAALQSEGFTPVRGSKLRASTVH